MPEPWAILGTVVQAPVFGTISLVQQTTVIVEDGIITHMETAADGANLLVEQGLQASSVLRLQDGEFLCPGFIDLHVHAPQYSYAGTATDRPLMEWLGAYAFPREKAHADAEAARAEYTRLAARLAAHGTTTALLFGTMHRQACQELALTFQQRGLRAFIGKVCMDRHSAEGYQETTQEALAETEAFLQWIEELGDERIQAAITPRFVPTCTPELLAGLGQLAAKYDSAVQSHISESFDEVEFSQALHPEVDGRDIELFERAGLLRNRAVMAHGTCLTSAELRRLAETGTAIAHCPLSNFFFGDRLLPVRDVLALGVKVGLGTDVAGGLDWTEAFWLATQGGAAALGLGNVCGTLEVGKSFDALRVDTQNSAAFDVFAADTPLDAFQKFVNLGDDRNISTVWVRGQEISKTP
ncbi:hypothetical protein WJX84_011060 [Apatococcus fuscideae]|uniref:Amidohydrolase-related domain-containing protein n=1 Tax=Apatococcus fuscideae TaxID=2026836 RepID=A0AAW1SS92_9CHLO